MIRRSSRFGKSFLFRVFSLYAILIIGSFILSIYLNASRIAKDLHRLGKRYEIQVLIGIRDYVEGLFTQIDGVFRSFYTPDYQGISMNDLISPYRKEQFKNVNKEMLISQSLYTIVLTHRFIYDASLIDFNDGRPFLMTQTPGRVFQSNFDFYSTEIYNRLVKAANQRIIITDYKPEFLKPNPTDSSVIVVAQNVYDINHYDLKQPIGALFLTIDPLILEKYISDNWENTRGQFLITDTDQTVLYNSDPGNTYVTIDPEIISDETVTSVLRSRTSDLYYYNILSEDAFFEEQRSHLRRLIYVFLLSLVLLVGSTLAITRVINFRINALLDYMKMVEKGVFDKRLLVTRNDEIALIERGFNRMCERLDDYVSIVYRSQLRAKDSEIKLLQYQINPHFMFNTLDSIQMSALRNQDMVTAEMIRILGRTFRWTLAGDAQITLREEIAHLKDYCRLQSLRYENLFELFVRVDGYMMSSYVPKMTLQPIVENTLYHGFNNMTTGGKIALYARKISDTLLLCISDNGSGMTEIELADIRRDLNQDVEIKDNHIGLININSRLKKLFGAEYGISIDLGETEGLVVTVSLPYRITE